MRVLPDPCKRPAPEVKVPRDRFHEQLPPEIAVGPHISLSHRAQPILACASDKAYEAVPGGHLPHRCCGRFLRRSAAAQFSQTRSRLVLAVLAGSSATVLLVATRKFASFPSPVLTHGICGVPSTEHEDGTRERAGEPESALVQSPAPQNI